MSYNPSQQFGIGEKGLRLSSGKIYLPEPSGQAIWMETVHVNRLEAARRHDFVVRSRISLQEASSFVSRENHVRFLDIKSRRKPH